MSTLGFCIFAIDQSRTGLAIYDISDLNNPVLLSTLTDGGPGGYWLFGQHAVEEALRNPRRQIHRVVAAGDAGAALGRGVEVEAVERDFIDKLVGRDVVHQGLAARVSPLPETDIYEICDLARDRENAVLVVLDQVTDPHNVGAILRSAAAFGAIGIILTERHAAPESGILAKSASGALERDVADDCGPAVLDSTAGRRLGPADREVAERVNGRWDVASIALACPLREVETLKALRKLVRLGLVALAGR